MMKNISCLLSSLGLEKYMYREDRMDRPFGNAFDDDCDMTYDAWERRDMAAARKRRVKSAPDHTPTAKPAPGRTATKSRQNDDKYNSSTLPRKLFLCNQCDPPRYFIVDALTHKEIIDHIMETNHAIGVDEVSPLSVLKKFHFRDPWVDQ